MKFPKILYEHFTTNIVIYFLFPIMATGCNNKQNTKQNTLQMDTTTHKYTNHLIHETSPYLLQHAHNPVNWYAWGDEALEKAKKENKLILISIGYSACHWCHVMEHESFEDEATAKIMNELYVCIKVDREERPDIDQVYMNAVQLITGQGGWPLNCFTLPDGRPIYGGTYFPNAQWNDVLIKLADFYKKNPGKANETAEELTHGIKASDVIKINTNEAKFTIEDAKATYEPWATLFDPIEGGPNRAPKFPLPNNYLFLLHYYHATKDKSAFNQIKVTLDKMAYGGIYDQIGGGFSRYATDSLWKIPHFEKMLYDNGQLVSLYSEAYQLTKDALYKQVVYETLEFIEREMTSPEGGFYSALDADSEGEEGKFYVWGKPELETLLKDKFPLVSDYYNVNNIGFWEHGNYILLRKKTDAEIAKVHGLTLEQLQKEIASAKKIMLAARKKRIRPGLDDKQLTSWNALMLKGYVDAYTIFNEQHFLSTALNNAEFILTKLRNPGGGLNHILPSPDGEGLGVRSINGYLEDYCFTIEAFIALYQATFDEKWLITARQLMDYAIAHFYDKTSGMFFFTSDIDKALIARKMELNDNVIPASNSSIAKGLFLLGNYYDNNDYKKMASKMLNNVKENMPRYGSGYSNWGLLLLQQALPFYEVAIVGADAEKKRKELSLYFIPNKIVAGSKTANALPLLQDRYVDGRTLIYVCENKVCKLPLEKVEEALKLMK